MYRHSMNRSETIVICEMKNDNVQDQRGMGGFYLVFRTEINGDAILPFFQLVIQLSNSVKEFAIGLFRGLR